MDGYGRVIVIWAASSQITWFLTIYLFGAFPSMEIFLAILALGYVEDRMRELGITYTNAKPEPTRESPKTVVGRRQPELVEV